MRNQQKQIYADIFLTLVWVNYCTLQLDVNIINGNNYMGYYFLLILLVSITYLIF